MINLLNQLLLEILAALTEQLSPEDPELASRRHTVKLFLRALAENEAHLDDAWTLEKMSSHCGMGVTAFSKYCRALTNCAPVEYLNHCRLDQAARQLRTCRSLPVTEIAFRVGFSSSQYFATTFLRRFGLSPRAYRVGGLAR